MGEWSSADAGGSAKGALGRAAETFAAAFLAETDRWFLWTPVCFAAGIALYFGAVAEPPAVIGAAVLLAGFALALLTRRLPVLWALSMAALCAAAGFADAQLRAALLATPTLARETGPVQVEGWVEQATAKGETGVRLTLKVTSITTRAGQPVGAARHLERVRITSRIKPAPRPGQAVRVAAVLRPAPDPVMPGGFDFSRKAWFAGIGAVGFAVGAAEPLGPAAPPDWRTRAHAALARVRNAVGARVHVALPGETGALAGALITGERGRIPEAVLESLRHSGLAHLLAISGLHMALMAGSLFWLGRALLAAFPAVALRLPVKKIAALAALAGGGFYLALSGAAIATQRAYLMMALLFLAVLLDRPAITLRNVALAALVVLALYPESLFDVSFQMSFAAAASLVAVYERLAQRQPLPTAPGGRVARAGRTALRYMGGIALTTLVASIAVAPFAAYHFHKLAQFGLIANLAAMPLFGLLVMPMALAALLAMPFGLEWLPLAVMGEGLEGIIAVAQTVSDWDGAVIRIAQIPDLSLLALVLGGLWLVLWRTRWRLAGLLFAAMGLALSPAGPRPDVLIDRDGALVALRAADGGLAVGAKGPARARYSLQRWLEASGVSHDATDGDAFSCDAIACVGEIRSKTVAYLLHPAALAEECARADIVIARFPLGKRCAGPRVALDVMDLKAGGAHALYLDGQSIQVETAAARQGKRPWSRDRLALPQPDDGSAGTAFAAD